MNTVLKRFKLIGLAMLICFALPAVADDVRDLEKHDAKDLVKHQEKEKYLFVWAGDKARDNPDFLAVINFDEESDNYGKVITTMPLPPPGNTIPDMYKKFS
jgi:uncharacterized protein YbaA (DUF1428 family)